MALTVAGPCSQSTFRMSSSVSLMVGLRPSGIRSLRFLLQHVVGILLHGVRECQAQILLSTPKMNAMMEHGSAGFCTPGVVLRAKPIRRRYYESGRTHGPCEQNPIASSMRTMKTVAAPRK